MAVCWTDENLVGKALEGCDSSTRLCHQWDIVVIGRNKVLVIFSDCLPFL